MADEIKQNSEEWLEWRRLGVGGSDVAAVLNISPWRTAFQLWQEKTGRKEFYVSNAGTERGQELESTARALYELHKGFEAPPALIESEEYPFMRVSLDGRNKQHSRIVEIKCPGAAVIELAKAGSAPRYYLAQMQYQLLISGADVCDYVVYDGSGITTLEIMPDPELQREIFDAVCEFWNMVEKDVPPMLSDKDYKEFDDIKTLTYLAELRAILEKKQELKTREDHLRVKIQESMDHPRMSGAGMRVIKVERPGTIDWKAATEGKDIDPEQFRKTPIVSYQFRIEKENDNV